MNAFCASVNFDAFTVLHSSQPGKSEQKTLTQNDPIFREQSTARNYARIAAELALREFCETRKVPVPYQQLPDKTPASELLNAAKKFSTTAANGLYDGPLAAIEMYTPILLNQLSHGGVPAVTSHEVRGALNAVETLLFALKVTPTRR